MRQLDLFGSFSEIAPQENQPGEKSAVVNKQTEPVPVADPSGPSYSKNSLRSERTATSNGKTPGKNGENVTENDELEAAKTIALSPPAAFLLSLFDQVAATTETENKGIEEVVPEKVDTAQPEQLSEQINGDEVLETQTTNEVGVFIAEEPVVVSTVPASPQPVVELTKKTAAARPKKPKLPELQRNGSVIFDDGKITVKIKNASPFPAPIVKEKKEKPKRLPQKRGRKSFKEIDAEVDLVEIPDDELLFQKQYYPISEVAKWFRVNTSLLRFWENEFDVLKPRKNRKGDRLFRPEDVKNLQLIYQLLRHRKYTIEGAKEYIKTNKKKADIQMHLTNTLQKFKNFLLDLKANLQP